MKLLPIIGLEIHAQLKTASKMFCACPNVDDGAAPNSAICPVCTGQPGALPALNQQALELGVLTGLALDCDIPDFSVFDRKNYFYPDLPKGYQISQFHLPIALKGTLEIDVPPGSRMDDSRATISVNLTRAHLEEDAAKNVHASGSGAEASATYVDYNRSGTPLLEIVTEPDLRSPQEAKIFMQELRSLLRTIGAADADMEKGQMRCDANISLLSVDADNLPLQHDLNPKIEIKNLNSYRAVERALTHEIKRQTEMHQAGLVPSGATRGWDEDKGETFEQRSKETSSDYRYFPEPDLPPQDLRELKIKLASKLPELPKAKRGRLADEFGFSAADTAFLTGNDGWADYAEHVMGELGGWLEASDDKIKAGGMLMDENKKKLAKLAGGWLTSKLAGLLADKNIPMAQLKIDPENFAEFLKLIYSGEINSSNAMKLLEIMLETGGDPSQIMEERDLGQNMDEGALLETVKRIVEQNPDQVAQVKAGKLGVIKWFVGAVMKATEGKANPAQAEEMVKKEIGV
ncbi:MAG: Asp-tRNA(Asn)/Glu-tRNA(Gln) amidotransferase subunit GatB [Patescibacteria group bacterium]